VSDDERFGRVYPAEQLRTRAAAISAGGALALLPDADVLGLALGLSDEGFWGHRGYSHTLAFAGRVAGAVFVLLRRRAPDAGFAAVLAFLAVGSHGVLDARPTTVGASRSSGPCSMAA
jgi:inner membrane protein